MAREGVLVKGSVLSVCATPQIEALTQAEFEALTYVEVCCPSSLPEIGQEAEIVSEFCVSGEEITGVGASSGSETDLEVFYFSECVGQDIVRESYGGNDALAFKKELSDGTATTTPTTIYFRAIVTSWSDGGGEVNDVVTHTYGLKMAQDPIFVKPQPIP